MRFFLFSSFFFVLMFCSSRNKEYQTVHNNKDTPQKNIVPFDSSKHNIYTWNTGYSLKNKLVNRISVPDSYKRQELPKKSFAEWLRNIPLKKGNPDVMLYDGKKKGNQSAQFAVIDIDVGKRDLQQCADAVMRLRAEYLFSSFQKEKIAFNFTSGDKCSYSNWEKGIRPIFSENKVSFSKTSHVDASYKNFKKYLQIIFSYCGTYSLEKELHKVSNINDIQAGDVFITGGFPGHAIIVMDVAINITTKKKIFLLAQSYMPAQDIHILKNNNESFSPWYSIDFKETLFTPKWNFSKSNLKMF